MWLILAGLSAMNVFASDVFGPSKCNYRASVEAQNLVQKHLPAGSVLLKQTEKTVEYWGAAIYVYQVENGMTGAQGLLEFYLDDSYASHNCDMFFYKFHF